MQIIRKKALILLFNHHGIVDGKAHSTNALRNNLIKRSPATVSTAPLRMEILIVPTNCELFIGISLKLLPVTWLNTSWPTFFVESFGLKILSQVTTNLSQLHSNSRNKHVNSRKYHNVRQMRCMHARPHRRKDQLPLRSLRDFRSR